MPDTAPTLTSSHLLYCTPRSWGCMLARGLGLHWAGPHSLQGPGRTEGAFSVRPCWGEDRGAVGWAGPLTPVLHLLNEVARGRVVKPLAQSPMGGGVKVGVPAPEAESPRTLLRNVRGCVHWPQGLPAGRAGRADNSLPQSTPGR